YALLDLKRELDRLRVESGLGALDGQEAHSVDLAEHCEHRAVAMLDADRVARAKQLQVLGDVAKADHRGEVRETQAVAPEEALERIAGLHDELEHGSRRVRDDTARRRAVS